MKTKKEIEEMIKKLALSLIKENYGVEQKLIVMGVVNGLCWAIGNDDTCVETLINEFLSPQKESK